MIEVTVDQQAAQATYAADITAAGDNVQARHAAFHKMVTAFGGKSETQREYLTPPQSFQTAATAQAIAQNAKKISQVSADDTGGFAEEKAHLERLDFSVDSDVADNVAQFDADMRAKGSQTASFEKDTKAEAFLLDLFRKTPEAQRTTAWRQTFERDLAQVYEGRRYGETPQAFAARKEAMTATPAAVTPAPNAPATPPAPGEPTSFEYASAFLAPYVNNDGGVPHKYMTDAVTSGYKLPTPPDANWHWDAGRLVSGLATAKKMGLSQQQVTAFLQAEFGQ